MGYGLWVKGYGLQVTGYIWGEVFHTAGVWTRYLDVLTRKKMGRLLLKTTFKVVAF